MALSVGAGKLKDTARTGRSLRQRAGSHCATAGTGHPEPVRKAGRGLGAQVGFPVGSYSRYWGARAAAGPRSPSSRSFCRSGKQRPRGSGVTSAAGSKYGPSPCRDLSLAPSTPPPSLNPSTGGPRPQKRCPTNSPAPVPVPHWCQGALGAEQSSPLPTHSPPPTDTHRLLQYLGGVRGARALLLAAVDHRGGSPAGGQRSVRWPGCVRDGAGGPTHPVPPTLTFASTRPWELSVHLPPAHRPPRIISSFPG